jgi:hypothetical protein
MNAFSHIQAVEEAYSDEFLTALAGIAKRSEEAWNVAAAKRDGDVAERFRNRALEYRGLYFDAKAVLDGRCEASLASLHEYFDTDHLLLWKEVERG